jgi:hypothetical protein
MSVEAWTITPEYTISGTGPYTITHPYVAGAILAFIQLSTGRLQLNGSEFAVSPTASDTTGNLTLSPTLAATYAGQPLIIDRVTPDEQGWLAVLGEREAGLAAQLDRMTQSTQELRARGAGALRTRTELEPFDWDEGTVPILEGGKPKSGPTATEITNAQTRATEAAASAAAAAASAADALAKQNSMLRDRGAWVTLTLYSPSDIFTANGTSYITQTAHIASSIAADLSANRIRVFAAKGDAGAGTGDMLKTENLSGLASLSLARTNLGLQALAIKNTAAFADIDPAAVITDVETLAANKVANALPSAKAVTDYVDPQLRILLADKTVTGAPAATMDFTEFNNALYRYYAFQLENVKPTTDAAGLLMRFSTDGGSTYDAGAGNYNWVAGGQTNTGAIGSSSLSDTSISVTFGMGNASGERGATGELTLYFAGQAVRSKVIGLLSIEGAADNTTIMHCTGRRLADQDTTAVRFLMGTGNIAVGSRIRMYGFN